MIIVIDGYNLLRHLFPSAEKTSARIVKLFVQQLAAYKKEKNVAVSAIITVFDAGPSRHATRLIKAGIVIMYAGTDSDADEWILEYVKKNRAEHLLIVTLDKALREACNKYGADWLSVYDFYTIMQTTLHHSMQKNSLIITEKGFEKYDNSFIEGYDEYREKHSESSTAIDHLMYQLSPVPAATKEEQAPAKNSTRKSPSDTLSKKEKRLLLKIKKLE